MEKLNLWLKYNSMALRRRAPMRRRPAVRSKYGRKARMLPRRRVAGSIHSVKRIGNTVFVQNSAAVGGAPFLTSDGLNSFFQGAAVAAALPNCWDFTLSSQFQLSSVVDPADLTQLFDRYKIVGVQLKVHYLTNSGMNVGTSNLPTIHYAFDGDDANVPPNTQSVLVKGYCKTRVLNANRPLSIYVKPRITKEIYNSPITTGYSSEKACWLDAASSGIPHFGMKFAITDWVGGQENNNALRITPTYYLKLRDTQ